MNSPLRQIGAYAVRVLDWLLYTSVFASVCAVALCMATERLILQRIPPVGTVLHLFIFGSSMMIYNIHYLIRKPAAGVTASWLQVRRHRDVWLAIAGVLLCLVTAPFLNWPVLFTCGILSVCSLAYSVPLLPFPQKRRLKDFGWIKIWILTGVWTAVTAIIPMLYWQQQMTDYPFEILIRFVLMFVLCLAFDVRDVHIDEEAGIYTLPSKIGLRATYRLIDLLLLLFALLCLVQFLRYGSTLRFTGSVLSAVLARIAVHYAGRHPSNKAYLLYVDGVMLLYALLVLLH